MSAGLRQKERNLVVRKVGQGFFAAQVVHDDPAAPSL